MGFYHLFLSFIFFTDPPPSKFKLTPGATCASNYRPLTSSWQDCEVAAKFLGFTGDNVCCVDYDYSWGRYRPQGCFQSGDNKRIHFNKGQGGRFEGADAILCQYDGKIID